jgi:hypothetical protein
MKFGQKKIPDAFYVVVIGYLIYTLLFTPNFLVTVLVALFPLFAFRLLWIDGQTNVLFWGMMLQWLNSATQILYCNFLGITLAERAKDGSFPRHTMNDATTYSMIGLYFFTLGLFFIIKKIKHQNIELTSKKYNPRKVLFIYISVSIAIFLTSGIIWNFPSVVQYFYFFFFIKWGFFIVTFYIIHKQAPLLRSLLYFVIAVEVLLSFASFFAGNFLNIASFTVVALIILQPKLNFRAYFFITIGVGVLVHLLILWSAVKSEYRFFVSAGQSTQTIQVSGGEANSKLVNLITNVDDAKYQDGVSKFVDRLGYIQFFAATLEYVPKTVPYQNGEIYLSAVQHYLIPRFLNPNKKVLDDSKHTREFTGIGVSDADSATSFSLGYIADAYIDFGPIYMHVILFFFGALFGVFYKFLYTKAPNEIWSWILTVPFFLLININGADTKKALGWVLIYFLVVAIVRKQLIKRLDPLMRASTN